MSSTNIERRRRRLLRPYDVTARGWGGCWPGPRSRNLVGYRTRSRARPIHMCEEAPVFSERTSVGLDVHARSVSAAAIDGLTGEVIKARLRPVHEEVRGWVAGLPGPCAVTYEAGPTGFGLARALTDAGVRCEVAASSKLQRPAGDRVKTDARDALHLAKLLRLDAVVAVRIPSLAEEAARDLVRAREASRQDLMRARHRVSKLLLRHGIVYCGGKAWTDLHDRWVHRQRFDSIPTQA